MPERLVNDSARQQGLLQRIRRFLHDDLISSFKKELDNLIVDAHAQARDEIRRVLDIAVAHAEERVKLTIDELARPLREDEQRALEGFSAELIKQRSQELQDQLQAGRQVIEQSFEEQRKKVQAQIEGEQEERIREKAQQLDAQLQANVQELVRSLEEQRARIERLNEEAMRTALEKVRLNWEREAAGASAAITRAAAAVDQRFEEGAAQLKAVSQQLASGLDIATEKHRARLQETAAFRFDELHRATESLLQRLRAEGETVLKNSLDVAAQDFAARFRTDSQQLLGSWADQFQKQAQDASQKLSGQIEALGRLIAEQEERVGERSRQIDAQVQGKLGEMDRAFEERRVRIRALTEEHAQAVLATGQQLESVLNATVEKHHTRLEELSASRFEELRRSTESLLHGVRADAEAALHNSVERTADEFTIRIRRSAQEAVASWLEQLQKEARDAGLRLKEAIEGTSKAIDEQNQRKLAAVEAMAGLLRQHAQEAVDAFRTGLQSTLKEYRETGAKEFEARLEGIGRQHEVLRDQLRREIEQVAEEAVTQVKGKLDQASQEVSDAIFKQVGVATVAANELTSRTQGVVERSLQEQLERFRTQIRGFADANLEELKRAAGSVVEGLHTRLQQAAKAVQPGTPSGGEGFPRG